MARRGTRRPAPRRVRADLAEVLRGELLAHLEGGGSGYGLAKSAGLAPSVVNRFADGSRSLSLDAAGRLAAALSLRLVPAAGRRAAAAPAGRRAAAAAAPVEVLEVEDAGGLDGPLG